MTGDPFHPGFWDGRPVPAETRAADAARAFRQALGITQTEAAALVGVPVQTWRQWEQGRTPHHWRLYAQTLWLHLAAIAGDDAARDWARGLDEPAVPSPAQRGRPKKMPTPNNSS